MNTAAEILDAALAYNADVAVLPDIDREGIRTGTPILDVAVLPDPRGIRVVITPAVLDGRDGGTWHAAEARVERIAWTDGRVPAVDVVKRHAAKLGLADVEVTVRYRRPGVA